MTGIFNRYGSIYGFLCDKKYKVEQRPWLITNKFEDLMVRPAVAHGVLHEMHIAALKWLESGAQSVVEHLHGVLLRWGGAVHHVRRGSWGAEHVELLGRGEKVRLHHMVRPGVVAPRGKWNDRRHLDEGRVHMRNEVVLSCRAARGHWA